ncbi:12862_t:CDS:2 [Acaulospora morrowiae]|uniref:12862_t:CDS:1 n=1 Tax=Acaulospora morrowiae TaxID=94023 RepID=A0A9N8WRA3_9GLOM|nr:12862_t:CDS:2 [Acaulospora morrowiae]
MLNQYTLRSFLRDTTPKYNDNLVARNNGKIIKKTTSVRKTTPFKRPMPISSRKANIIQETNLSNPKHLKSKSVLEVNMTDVSMEGNLSDTENSQTNSQEGKKKEEKNRTFTYVKKGKGKEPDISVQSNNNSINNINNNDNINSNNKNINILHSASMSSLKHVRVEESTGELNIVTIFSNYTDTKEVYTYPISDSKIQTKISTDT